MGLVQKITARTSQSNREMETLYVEMRCAHLSRPNAEVMFNGNESLIYFLLGVSVSREQISAPLSNDDRLKAVRF